MRYIYIVTRTVRGEKSGTSIPNLGVHTSKNRAIEHFDSVVEDRVKIGYKIIFSRWNSKFDYLDFPSFELKTAAMSYKGEIETLRLEVWKNIGGKRHDVK
jgi:hypothetical protein